MIRYKEGDVWKDAVLDYYPVGALYFTFSETSPADLFGGSWSLLNSAGRLIGVYGKNSNGTDVPAGEWGGSGVITISNIPAHSHKFLFRDNAGSLSGQGFYSSHFETNQSYHFWGYNNKYANTGYFENTIFQNQGGAQLPIQITIQAITEPIFGREWRSFFSGGEF